MHTIRSGRWFEHYDKAIHLFWKNNDDTDNFCMNDFIYVLYECLYENE